jgi:MYXO-CTERM domain-containing protein
MKAYWRVWIIGAIFLATLLVLWMIPRGSLKITDTVKVAHHVPRPPPTENWLEDIAEGVQKKNRKAWFKELHRTGPGVDYKEIERQNGLDQLAKRNQLALTEDNLRGPGLWMERGSDNQAGRMHVVQYSSDGRGLVAGSALGGIWSKSFDSETWSNIGDNLYGGAHWLAVLPPEEDGGPDVIIAATDWGSIHRTVDNGATWKEPLNLPYSQSIRRLLVTTDDSRTLYLIRGNGGQFSLHRSTDKGDSFELILDMGKYRGDLWAPRTGDSTLYLTMDDQLMMSPDMGDNWTTLGVLNSGGRRSELVGSEAGAPTLYAVTKADGEHQLHRSEDAGATWESGVAVTDYWGSLAVSSLDPDLFAWGGVELHVTRNGGESFQIQSGWAEYYDDPAGRLHADIPGIDVLPSDGGESETWYISTDGGLFQSEDSLVTVENLALQGLRVSQYYSTHTSAADPNHVAAGAQDQGYQRTEQSLPTDGPYSFTQHISGDYAHITSTDGTHDYLFSVYPGYLLVQVGENDPQFGWGDFPEGENYAWLPPLRADPQQKDAVYLGATRLYRYSHAGGGYWAHEAVSESFAAEEDEYISALVFSPIDAQQAWLATNRGRIFKSTDGATSWEQMNTVDLDAHYFYGHALEPSKVDINTITIGGSGYSGSGVFQSKDGGKHWTAWAQGLPATMVYGIAESNDETGTLFAATETAAYRRAPDDTAWVDITSNEAPVTIYWSVEALTHENTMRFGTYGRGIWDYRMDFETGDCEPVIDADGDGVACDEDCNDEDPTRYPGAEESCDGFDVNCDTEDLIEIDNDGDGFLACEECDDSNRFINPEASEQCGDGIDNDCQGGDAVCETPKKCGCTTGALGTSPVWLALLGLFAAGRRRKRQTPKRV